MRGSRDEVIAGERIKGEGIKWVRGQRGQGDCEVRE